LDRSKYQSHSVQELAEREKLVKMQDILACLNTNKKGMSDESTAAASSIEALKSQSAAVAARITAIKAKIEAAAEGKDAKGGGDAPAAAE